MSRPSTANNRVCAALLVCWLASTPTVANSTSPPPDAKSPWLPTAVGLHLRSLHSGPAAWRWQNNNTGLYLRWPSGLTLGRLHNSIGSTSNYIGWTWTHQISPRWQASLTAGAISGYERSSGTYRGGPLPSGYYTAPRCNSAGQCGPTVLRRATLPMLVPSIAVDIIPQARARLSLIPPTSKNSAAALHLSAEWDF